MRKIYPVIDVVKTGQNMKNIMRQRGLCVKDIQIFLDLSTPQSIYHWFDGRNLPTIDNLYALSELFRVPMDTLLVGTRKHECVFQSDIYQRIWKYYDKFRAFQ